MSAWILVVLVLSLYWGGVLGVLMLCDTVQDLSPASKFAWFVPMMVVSFTFLSPIRIKGGFDDNKAVFKRFAHCAGKRNLSLIATCALADVISSKTESAGQQQTLWFLKKAYRRFCQMVVGQMPKADTWM